MTESDRSQSAFDTSGWERTLKQAFELWINPEIERRRAAGVLNSNFRLATAQVLFGDSAPPIVRLNEEVRGLLQVQVSRNVTKGDPVYPDEINSYADMELLDDDRDYGHFTLIQHRDRWAMLFDFGRNKGSALELVNLAEQFLNAAEYCSANDLKGPFIDTLFSACELLAKARLITIILSRDASRSHGRIHSTINSWRKLGNVGDSFVDLFNELSRARGDARYRGKFPNGDIDKRGLDVVREEMQVLRSRYSPRIRGK